MSTLYKLALAHGASYADRAGSPVSRSLWQKIQAEDASFQAIETLQGRNPRTGEIIDMPCPYSAQWQGHPDNIPVSFIYHEQWIEVAWADEHVLQKAQEVAKRLGTDIYQKPFD